MGLFLPWEIIEKILVMNCDWKTLLCFKRYNICCKNMELVDVFRSKNYTFIRHFFSVKKQLTHKVLYKGICIKTFLDEPLFTMLINIRNPILNNVIINKVIDFDRVDVLKKLKKMGLKFDDINIQHAKNISSLYKSKCLIFLEDKV